MQKPPRENSTKPHLTPHGGRLSKAKTWWASVLVASLGRSVHFFPQSPSRTPRVSLWLWNRTVVIMTHHRDPLRPGFYPCPWRSLSRENGKTEPPVSVQDTFAPGPFFFFPCISLYLMGCFIWQWPSEETKDINNDHRHLNFLGTMCTLYPSAE